MFFDAVFSISQIHSHTFVFFNKSTPYLYPKCTFRRFTSSRSTAVLGTASYEQKVNLGLPEHPKIPFGYKSIVDLSRNWKCDYGSVKWWKTHQKILQTREITKKPSHCKNRLFFRRFVRRSTSPFEIQWPTGKLIGRGTWILSAP